MKPEEASGINMLLGIVKEQLKMVLDGYQALSCNIESQWKAFQSAIEGLDRKLESVRREIKGDVLGVAMAISRIEEKVKKTEDDMHNLGGILSKITELSEDHNRWLREHEVRLKALEPH